MDLHFPRKACPRLPPEVKDLIIDELQALKQPREKDVLSSIALVWKDASYTIRRHRFKDIRITALGSPTIPKSLYMILHLIRFAPSIAHMIQHMTVFWSEYPWNIIQEVYRHPGFPRLISLATNLTSVCFHGLTPNELPRLHGQRILDSISSLRRLTHLSLISFEIRRFSDLVRFIQSFQHLQSIRVNSLRVEQFLHVAQSEKSKDDAWGLEGGKSPLADYSKYPSLLCNLTFFRQTVRELDIECSTYSDCIFVDWLGNLFSHVERLRITVEHPFYEDDEEIIFPRTQPVLRKYRESLKELCFTDYDVLPQDNITIPPLLDILKFSIGNHIDDMHDVKIYIAALQQHLDAGRSFKSIVMNIYLDEEVRHRQQSMPPVELFDRLDQVLASTALGVRHLTWNVAISWEFVDSLPRLKTRPKRCWKKWLLHDAFPRTRKRFFTKGSKHLNGTEGQVHWRNYYEF